MLVPPSPPWRRRRRRCIKDAELSWMEGICEITLENWNTLHGHHRSTAIRMLDTINHHRNNHPTEISKSNSSKCTSGRRSSSRHWISFNLLNRVKWFKSISKLNSWQCVHSSVRERNSKCEITISIWEIKYRNNLPFRKTTKIRFYSSPLSHPIVKMPTIVTLPDTDYIMRTVATISMSERIKATVNNKIHFQLESLKWKFSVGLVTWENQRTVQMDAILLPSLRIVTQIQIQGGFIMGIHSVGGTIEDWWKCNPFGSHSSRILSPSNQQVLVRAVWDGVVVWKQWPESLWSPLCALLE